MDIAKPPSGFFIDEPATVKSYIASYAEKWRRLPDYWSDVKDLLTRVGHREGRRVDSGPPGARVYVAEGNGRDLPTIKVAYVVLGDTLRIHRLMVASADLPAR
jgi:hypothetical protein